MPGFGADFARRVLGNVVSEEESVRGVVSKVQLGEADAGIAYVSDVTPAVSRQVRILGIPDAANVVATYPVAVLKEARYPALARELVAFLLSPEGQRLLERFGLMGITGVEAAAPEPEPVPQPAPTRPLEK
jgi:molybdate transport system substrate-binding protein